MITDDDMLACKHTMSPLHALAIIPDLLLYNNTRHDYFKPILFANLSNIVM